MSNISNVELYEQDEAVSKYASKKANKRQLNIPEETLIDKYNIADKKVLILGGGAGRVPANLTLFGNTVTSVELSKKLHEVALQQYPLNNFPLISFINGDATKLEDAIGKDSFDITFFPMNGIDLIPTIEGREDALRNMAKATKKDGLVVFTSHNVSSYGLTWKMPRKRRNLAHLFTKGYVYEEEKVVGGGILFKGTPEFVVKHTEEVAGLKFDSMIFDIRNRVERKLSKTPLAKYIFPYIMYVFIKK